MKGIHGGDVYHNQVHMDFSVNINPLGMPQVLEDVLLGAAKKCQEYPDIEVTELKGAVSHWLNVPEEYLLFGNGASEVFMAIVHAIKPKKVCIPVPSFYGYEYAVEAVGAELVTYRLKEENDYLPAKDISEVLGPDIDMLFLTNPNNPTGKRMDREYLHWLLGVCKENEIYVVLDECFIEFCEDGESMLSEIHAYDHLMLVRAFTKIFAVPGVRLGYLVCSSTSLLGRIQRQLPEWNISTFAQMVGVSCTQQENYIGKTVIYVKEERQFLTKELRKMGIRVFDGEANFLLIFTEKPLYDLLLKQGILIRDCSNFKGLSKGYYRIAVKRRDENEKLVKAIGVCIG